jgi:hypothetical protein
MVLMMFIPLFVLAVANLLLKLVDARMSRRQSHDDDWNDIALRIWLHNREKDRR